MGAAKRTAEAVEDVVDAEALAARKAAKKAKKAAAAAAAAEPVVEEAVVEDDAAARKAAKKAKKAAAAAAAAAAEAPEEDAEAVALAAKKAAKKAKKAAAAAAAAEEEEAPKKKKKQEDEAPVEKKAAAAAPAAPAGDNEEWKDNTYKCMDCNEDWIDEAKDQEYRYSMGFAETPKRCKDCRWAKKVRMEGGDPTAKGKGKKGKDGGGKGNDENTVFVRGLPFAATEETLNKDFGDCGEIVTLRMPLNEEGSCKGFCFIKYTDEEGMKKALAFNETDYGGRTIYCSDAAIKPEGKGKGKDGKGKDGKDKGKGKGKKGKKGKASSEAFAKNTGAMVESTGTKVAFADSDDE